MKRRFSKLELAAVAFIALILLVIFPWLNSTPELHADGSVNFWHVSDFTVNLWGKYLCYALLAISVDLLWGFTGLLSLGQALFFSLGGYMLGMYLMLKIGELGSFAQAGNNPNLVPDFLYFLGHTVLPSFWKPFHSFPFALSMVVLVPGLLALVFGYLAFRSRIKGVYFSILTQALTYGSALLFFRNDLLMGGNNGFTDFKFILGHDIRAQATQRGLFIATALFLLLVYVGCRWLTMTKFGLVQRAIRDSETRVLFSGYAAANYKLFVFVVSAIIAGIAGALYVPQVGIINPSEMWPVKSLEAVVWCAVGGRGTLLGPIIGAVGVNWLKTLMTTEYPELWLIILGVMFIVTVLFLPKGVVGGIHALWNAMARRRPAEDADGNTEPAPQLAATLPAAEDTGASTNPSRP